MKSLFAATILYAMSFTICAFAVPDPAFYRPHKQYMNETFQCMVCGGMLFVNDGAGWFNVKSIQTNDKGVYFVTKFKHPSK